MKVSFNNSAVAKVSLFCLVMFTITCVTIIALDVPSKYSQQLSTVADDGALLIKPAPRHALIAQATNLTIDKPSASEAISQTERAARPTLTAYLSSLNEFEPRNKKSLLRKLFLTVGIDEQSIQLFSQELVTSFLSTNSQAKRQALVELMITLPGQASIDLGRLLIESNSERDIITGLNLLTTRNNGEKIPNSDLIHLAWSGPEDMATAALDATRVDLVKDEDKPSIVSALSEIVDIHTSGDVKAIALHRLVELDAGSASLQRLEDSLGSPHQDLSLTAANLIVTLNIQSPRVRESAAKILQNQSQSALLNASAAQILLGYQDLTPQELSLLKP